RSFPGAAGRNWAGNQSGVCFPPCLSSFYPPFAFAGTKPRRQFPAPRGHGMVTHPKLVGEVDMTQRFMGQRHTSFMVLMVLLCSVSAAVGQLSFGPATPYNTNTTPYSVAVGDFNGDGKLDIATPNNGTNDVSILLGNGNGTFQAPTNFPAGTGPQFDVAGDF